MSEPVRYKENGTCTEAQLRAFLAAEKLRQWSTAWDAQLVTALAYDRATEIARAATADIRQIADLIEELGRGYFYQAEPTSTPEHTDSPNIVRKVRVMRRPSDDAFRFFSGTIELIRLTRVDALQVATDVLELAEAVLVEHCSASPDGEPTGWTPSVLTEYEIGSAILAAQMIARSEKPVAEVGCQKVASTVALEDDLRECVKLAGHADNVRVWTRATNGSRVRYGFYREGWVLDALDFLDRAELADVDSAWISGLLFGYRGDAIQQFIIRTVECPPARAVIKKLEAEPTGPIAECPPSPDGQHHWIMDLRNAQVSCSICQVPR